MTNDWYTADHSHLEVATKMPTWRNGDAKLASGDVKASDEYLAGRLRLPLTEADKIGSSSSYLPKWRDARYVIGTWQEITNFQSGRNLYPFYGICTTADDTPSASLYTHTMAIRTTQTPIYMGRHWERENDTAAEAERFDILGMLPYSLHIECSELVPTAMMYATWMTSFVKTTGTDNIAEPSGISVDPFKWENFTFPTYTYNSETLECTIIGWSHDVMCGLRWVSPDSNGYYVTGKVLPFTLLATTLEVIPYGQNIRELMETALSGYATDVDLTVKCARHATNDYCQWTHDKTYVSPQDIAVTKRPGFVESYLLTHHQLSTGSCVPVVVDALDDDYYET